MFVNIQRENRMTFQHTMSSHHFIRQSLLILVSLVTTAAGLGQAPESKIDFAHDVVPILKLHCVTCHGGREQEGDFSINTRADVLGAGVIDSASPDASHLLDLITSADPDAQMPPADRERLSAKEVAVIKRWIAEGMAWDEDISFAVSSYEPPLRPQMPPLPEIVDGRAHPIDRILDNYLAERGIDRPAAIDDATFVRRVHLDLIGLLPTPQRLEQFLADRDPDKREQLIDELLNDRFGYAEHWLSFFNDLLRNDYSGTGFITGGRRQISKWLYESLLANKPFDVMTRELIAPPTTESRGYIDGIRWRGEVSAGQTVEIQFAQSISQSFLGINMKCASCHDSFIDRWTLQEAYGLAAIYSSRPLELHRCDKPTGQQAQPAWLFPELGRIDAAAAPEIRLQQLADLMTHRENGRFARTIVNRLWYRLMGRGIVHPLDAMQNEPWNADLLDFLAADFVAGGFDLKATLKRIAGSQAYQSQTEIVQQQPAAGDFVYRGPRGRRMTAEQFLDAVWQLSDSAPKSFDAPVIRSNLPPEAASGLTMQAQWIWGPHENNSVPANQQIALRTTVILPAAVAGGGAVITCDNEYRLYINRRQVSSGSDWTKPQAIAIAKHLKQGKNTFDVIVKNAGSSPNPAGLYFEAQLTLSDDSQLTIKSDDSWQFNAELPGEKEGRLGASRGQWQPVSIVPPVAAWTQLIQGEARRLLAAAVLGGGDLPMVRTSLLKNTALMKSLGRPMREQIVSMRPGSLTTLEAIDLANEPSLAASFAAAGRHWLQQSSAETDALVGSMFRAALSRDPSAEERALFVEALGAEPTAEGVQDALWAICMLPEFLLIR